MKLCMEFNVGNCFGGENNKNKLFQLVGHKIVCIADKIYIKNELDQKTYIIKDRDGETGKVRHT